MYDDAVSTYQPSMLDLMAGTAASLEPLPGPLHRHVLTAGAWVDVLPGWMQTLSVISPATYALEGIRAAVLDGATLGDVWGDLWPLLVLGALAVPVGLAVFRAGERYAKRHGKLKRSG